MTFGWGDGGHPRMGETSARSMLEYPSWGSRHERNLFWKCTLRAGVAEGVSRSDLTGHPDIANPGNVPEEKKKPRTGEDGASRVPYGGNRDGGGNTPSMTSSYHCRHGPGNQERVIFLAFCRTVYQQHRDALATLSVFIGDSRKPPEICHGCECNVTSTRAKAHGGTSLC
jgi:hypothetical protein